MLEFRSAATRSVNAQRAVLECLEAALGDDIGSADAVIINSAVGHDVAVLSAHAARLCPNARVLAASCAGTVGREGPGESLRDIALMVVRGEGFSVVHVDGLYGHNSFEKGQELARELLGAPRPVRMVYLLASGIDIANDRLIAGIESVLGPEVVLFGATSSDEMRGVATFQAVDGVRYQHSAFALAIWDETLEVDTQATHGFMAVGEPMVVTAARGNRILALDGAPAWATYLRRLGLPADAELNRAIPIGALAEALSPEHAAEYGNPHILAWSRITARMQYPLAGADGVPPWLGMYGFGEYAHLGGRNAYHNYTTALAALYRVGARA
jgi:hypothetical protein